MNKTLKIIGLLSLALLISSTPILAQRGNGWGQKSTYGKMFNPQSVETLTGSVIAVERILPEANMTDGLHLKVKTKTETISIHLGPTWYLDRQEMQFAKGDLVTITGSRIVYKNAPAVIAVEVVRNDFTLQLRDHNGFPAWNGTRRKGMGKRGPNG